MARYIDESEIKFTGEVYSDDSEIYVRLSDVKKAIAQTPTADVEEVKHGEWIKKYPLYKIDGIFVCSNCKHELDIATGEETPIDRGFFYCPNCGAKMDGKGD